MPDAVCLRLVSCCSGVRVGALLHSCNYALLGLSRDVDKDSVLGSAEFHADLGAVHLL